MSAVEVAGLSDVQSTLNGLASDDTKRRILTRLAKEIGNNSKKRVRSQTDLSGTAWTPRKDGKRKKMLVKTGQSIKTVSVSNSEAVIGFSNPVVARIAAKHQYAISQTVTTAQLRRKREVSAEFAARHATTKQAKALLDAGFKVRKPRGGFKTPTKKWITENLTIQQAGLILADLRGRTPADSWVIPTPKRDFLGITNTELATLADAALTELNRRRT